MLKSFEVRKLRNAKARTKSNTRAELIIFFDDHKSLFPLLNYCLTRIPCESRGRERMDRSGIEKGCKE